jgi:hypothetical protein
MDPKEISEIVKNYAQIGAWVAAGVYFLVKAMQGFFVIDVSLSTSLERTASPEIGVDYLSVAVDLKRGARGTLRMHDAVVSVTQGQTIQELKLGIGRVSFTTASKRRSVNVAKLSDSAPTLNLAPGESARFSTWCSVASDEPCTVDVVVIGTMFLSPAVGQWRTSAISLPPKSE